MKNLLVALFVFVALSASSFADVKDNTLLSTKTGTGQFSCIVIQPLVVSFSGGGVLGEFVAGADYPEVDLANNEIAFVITGQPSHAFSLKMESSAGTAPSDVTITTVWSQQIIGTPGWETRTDVPPGTYNIPLGATMGSDGIYKIWVKVTGLHAVNPNPSVTFDQTVTCSYGTL
jgi:opacity protein-like surface antigen